MDSHVWYVACNDDYIPLAVVALVSYKQHNPGHDLYILSDECSHAELMNQHGIQWGHVDLHDDFALPQIGKWPRYCFWIFYGPEYFYNLGYKTCASVDGDTLCVKNVDIRFLFRDYDLCCIRRRCGNEANTGVIFYKTENLVNKKFYEKIRVEYLKNVANDSDQHLFNYWKNQINTEIKIGNLDSRYNFLITYDHNWAQRRNANVYPKEELFIVHILQKYWAEPIKPFTCEYYKYYYDFHKNHVLEVLARPL